MTAYFAALYDANYRDAAANDGPDRVIFIEGARITLEAHIAEYPQQHHDELRKVLKMGDRWNPRSHHRPDLEHADHRPPHPASQPAARGS